MSSRKVSQKQSLLSQSNLIALFQQKLRILILKNQISLNYFFQFKHALEQFIYKKQLSIQEIQQLYEKQIQLFEYNDSFPQQIKLLFESRSKYIKSLKNTFITQKPIKKQLNLSNICDQLTKIRDYSLKIIQNIAYWKKSLNIFSSDTYSQQILNVLSNDIQFLKLTPLRKYLQFSSSNDPLFMYSLIKFMKLSKNTNSKSIIQLFDINQEYRNRLQNAQRFIKTQNPQHIFIKGKEESSSNQLQNQQQQKQQQQHQQQQQNSYGYNNNNINAQYELDRQYENTQKISPYQPHHNNYQTPQLPPYQQQHQPINSLKFPSIQYKKNQKSKLLSKDKHKKVQQILKPILDEVKYKKKLVNKLISKQKIYTHNIKNLSQGKQQSEQKRRFSVVNQKVRLQPIFTNNYKQIQPKSQNKICISTKNNKKHSQKLQQQSRNSSTQHNNLQQNSLNRKTIKLSNNLNNLRAFHNNTNIRKSLINPLTLVNNTTHEKKKHTSNHKSNNNSNRKSNKIIPGQFQKKKRIFTQSSQDYPDQSEEKQQQVDMIKYKQLQKRLKLYQQYQIINRNKKMLNDKYNNHNNNLNNNQAVSIYWKTKPINLSDNNQMSKRFDNIQRHKQNMTLKSIKNNPINNIYTNHIDISNNNLIVQNIFNKQFSPKHQNNHNNNNNNQYPLSNNVNIPYIKIQQRLSQQQLQSSRQQHQLNKIIQQQHQLNKIISYQYQHSFLNYSTPLDKYSYFNQMNQIVNKNQKQEEDQISNNSYNNNMNNINKCDNQNNFSHQLNKQKNIQKKSLQNRKEIMAKQEQINLKDKHNINYIKSNKKTQKKQIQSPHFVIDSNNQSHTSLSNININNNNNNINLANQLNRLKQNNSSMSSQQRQLNKSNAKQSKNTISNKNLITNQQISNKVIQKTEEQIKQQTQLQKNIEPIKQNNKDQIKSSQNNNNTEQKDIINIQQKPKNTTQKKPPIIQQNRYNKQDQSFSSLPFTKQNKQKLIPTSQVSNSSSEQTTNKNRISISNSINLSISSSDKINTDNKVQNNLQSNVSQEQIKNNATQTTESIKINKQVNNDLIDNNQSIMNKKVIQRQQKQIYKQPNSLIQKQQTSETALLSTIRQSPSLQSSSSSIQPSLQSLTKCTYQTKSLTSSQLSSFLSSLNIQPILISQLQNQYFSHRHLNLITCSLNNQIISILVTYPTFLFNQRYVIIVIFKVISKKYIKLTNKLANTSIKYIFYNDPCENVIYLRPKSQFHDQTENYLEKNIKEIKYLKGKTQNIFKSTNQNQTFFDDKAFFIQRKDQKCKNQQKYLYVIEFQLLFITTQSVQLPSQLGKSKLQLSQSYQSTLNKKFASGLLPDINKLQSKQQLLQYLQQQQLDDLLQNKQILQKLSLPPYLIYQRLLCNLSQNVKFTSYGQIFYFYIPDQSNIHNNNSTFYWQKNNIGYLFLKCDINTQKKQSKEQFYFGFIDFIYESTEKVNAKKCIQDYIEGKSYKDILRISPEHGKKVITVPCFQSRTLISNNSNHQSADQIISSINMSLNWENYLKGVRFVDQSQIIAEYIAPFYFGIFMKSQDQKIRFLCGTHILPEHEKTQIKQTQ